MLNYHRYSPLAFSNHGHGMLEIPPFSSMISPKRTEPFSLADFQPATFD